MLITQRVYAMHTQLSVVSKAWNMLLDVVYPPRCGGCDRRGTLFCEECLLLMMPPNEANEDASHYVSGIKSLVCAGAFHGPLREAIHKFKYESDTPLAKPLANFLYGAIVMGEVGDELESNPPEIMFVPLHKDKQRSRGFNQSELIARELSRLTRWPLGTGLVRVKATRSQVGLHRGERHENVRDAFEWQGGEAPRRVLLVDDLSTTGPTLSECASILRVHGVECVWAATVAKALGIGGNADL